MKFEFNAKQLSDEQLTQAAKEIATVAQERNLALPFAQVTGPAAVEAATTEGGTSTLDTKEALREELSKSHEAYQVFVEAAKSQEAYEAFVEAANEGLVRREKPIEILDEQEFIDGFETWFTPARQAYEAQAMEKDPELYFVHGGKPRTAPSREAAKAVSIAIGGERSSLTADEYDELFDKYSEEELHGPVSADNADSKIEYFSVPSKYGTEIAAGTVREQRAQLEKRNRKLQAEFPGLTLRALSPNEAVIYVLTLLAQGKKLEDVGLTYSRCIGLDHTAHRFWLGVPFVAAAYGGLRVGYSGSDSYDGVRSLVG